MDQSNHTSRRRAVAALSEALTHLRHVYPVENRDDDTDLLVAHIHSAIHRLETEATSPPEPFGFAHHHRGGCCQ